MLKALGIVSLLLELAFGQSTKPPQSFETVEIQPASSRDSWVSVGILPNGYVRCHNATLRMLIAAAYDRDADLVTAGPAWLDSDRFDITAKTAPTSKGNVQLMLQTLLGQRFKLALRHNSKTEPTFTLTVAKDGHKMHASASSDKDCPRGEGPPSQIHLTCHAFSMADLADLLPEVAPAYVTLPVLNQTDLKGTYDFNLDWMSRGAYDAAIANQSAGRSEERRVGKDC